MRSHDKAAPAPLVAPARVPGLQLLDWSAALPVAAFALNTGLPCSRPGHIQQCAANPACCPDKDACWRRRATGVSLVLHYAVVAHASNPSADMEPACTRSGILSEQHACLLVTILGVAVTPGKGLALQGDLLSKFLNDNVQPDIKAFSMAPAGRPSGQTGTQGGQLNKWCALTDTCISIPEMPSWQPTVTSALIRGCRCAAASMQRSVHCSKPQLPHSRGKYYLYFQVALYLNEIIACLQQVSAAAQPASIFQMRLKMPAATAGVRLAALSMQHKACHRCRLAHQCTSHQTRSQQPLNVVLPKPHRCKARYSQYTPPVLRASQSSSSSQAVLLSLSPALHTRALRAPVATRSGGRLQRQLHLSLHRRPRTPPQQ